MKTIYALMGAPGVGKTTFISEQSKEIFGDDRLHDYVIGPDVIRRLVASPELKPDGTVGISQKNEKFIWKFINDVLEKKTHRGEVIIVDATHSRNSAISNYKKYSDNGYRVVVVDFSSYADLDEIKRRNRQREGIKFVPEDVIETMYERIKSIDLPGWIQRIEPKEFKEHFTNVKMDFNEYDSLTFIGDIHSCNDELIKILEVNDIDMNEKDAKNPIIFLGDYFDRGPNPVGTFRTLQTLQRNRWVLFLMGNHEESLRYYKEFVRDVSDTVQKEIRENILPQVKRREQLREASKQLAQKLYELSEEPKNIFEHIKFMMFEKYNEEHYHITAEQIKINTEIIESIPDIEDEAQHLMKVYTQSSFKHFDAFVEKLRKYPIAFKALEDIVYGYRLPKELIKDEFNHHVIKRTSMTTMRKFLLSDIKYTEVAELYKRCSQLFYADYGNKTIVATHGGLADLPNRTTPTANFIRGVGGYGDAQLCDETFHKKNPDAISIHGHRNLENIPMSSTPGTYNLNGDVELGLRSLRIEKEEAGIITDLNWVEPFPSTMEHHRKRQLKSAQKFKAKKLTHEEESKGIMQLFQDHTHVDIKRLPNNIASINFSRKAFEHGVWDNITIKARGLFMAIDPKEELPKDYVIARGYEKFFNIGERYGFDEEDIRHLAYPIRAYEKANGYIGLLAVDNRDPKNPKWFTSSKSTTEGDFADNFRRMVTPMLTDELMDKIKEDNVTLAFEVIDPVFDPHIEKYSKQELVLLDAIINKVDFIKKRYEYLGEYLELMKTNNETDLRVKELVKLCDTYADYYSLVKEANSVDLLENNGIEGFVFEDATGTSPNMFKLKTRWYSFWKYQRSNKDRIYRAIEKNVERGNPPGIEKSQLIKMKAKLHTAEDIKVFNFMVDYFSKHWGEVQKNISIIEIRDEFIKGL